MAALSLDLRQCILERLAAFYGPGSSEWAEPNDGPDPLGLAIDVDEPPSSGDLPATSGAA